MTIPPWLILAALSFTVSLGFGSGWKTNDWYRDSVDLAELNATNKAINASMDRESKIAGVVEEKLKNLRANERVIEREKIKLVDRPIYKSDCIDVDGLQLINRSKTAPAAKPAD
jgi:hypothetical protein